MEAFIRVGVSLLLFSSLISGAPSTDCGDSSWDSYKDDKCFKILDQLVTYNEGRSLCSKETKGASNTFYPLLTIENEQEQDFLTNLLMEKNVVDNVWLGAGRIGNTSNFRWADGSNMTFTRWRNGSPSTSSSRNCTQMNMETSEDNQADQGGQWIDTLCRKKNVAVCQKEQVWSSGHMQKIISSMKKQLEVSDKSVKNLIESLNNSTNVNSELRTQITRLEENPVPIGFVYVQLGRDNSPTKIWPNVKWMDVSGEYGGLFFRVEGAGSTAFGEVQDENCPRLTNVHHDGKYGGDTNWRFNPEISINYNGEWSESVRTATSPKGDWFESIRFKSTGGEVRPKNMAIRVWRRVA